MESNSKPSTSEAQGDIEKCFGEKLAKRLRTLQFQRAQALIEHEIYNVVSAAENESIENGMDQIQWYASNPHESDPSNSSQSTEQRFQMGANKQSNTDIYDTRLYDVNRDTKLTGGLFVPTHIASIGTNITLLDRTVKNEFCCLGDGDDPGTYAQKPEIQRLPTCMIEQIQGLRNCVPEGYGQQIIDTERKSDLALPFFSAPCPAANNENTGSVQCHLYTIHPQYNIIEPRSVIQDQRAQALIEHEIYNVVSAAERDEFVM